MDSRQTALLCGAHEYPTCHHPMTLKILMGCSSPPDQGAGGILSYTLELIDCLSAEGAEIHLASPRPQSMEWCTQRSVQHIPTDPHDKPDQAIQRIFQAMHTNAFNGIINNDNPFLQCLFPVSCCPTIAIGHFDRSLIASLACFQPAWSDYVVAISNDMAKRYINHYAIPADRCVHIPNSLRDPGPPPSGKPMGTNDLKTIFVGGNERRKGADQILTALRNHREHWNGKSLDWFGNLPEKIQRRINAYPFIRYHGARPRESVLSSLQKSDVLLFPSRFEGCPMAVLEAMCHGVVPIVSDGDGAMKDMIIHGENGFICPLSHWPQCAMDYLCLLQRDPQLLERMKASTRQRFLDEYNSRNTAKKLLALLEAPTVDRSNPPSRIRMLHWHRPIGAITQAPGWLQRQRNRIQYRLGRLRPAGWLQV